MELSGRTCMVGIFGDPVAHSLSPAMHNTAFRELNMDWCYAPFHVLPRYLEEAVRGVRALGLRGVNVTVPHKETIMPLLDVIDPEAVAIGAVNTIVNEGGVLAGHNTDAFGFVRSLEAKGILISGRRVHVLGAGGAARAVCHGLLGKGLSSMLIVNRTVDKADRLAAHLAVRYPGVDIRAASGTDLSTADIVVNTTSLGLHASDPFPLDPMDLRADLVVCDLVYRPGGTPLLRRADERGCHVIDGAGMLLWQGWQAFKLWTGLEPPVSAMTEALRQAGVQT